MSAHLSWLEAGVIGALQGVSELFPVSSLGHSVLVPAWVGGSWARDLDVARPQSPYLAFIVGLHVATAIALIVYFWRDWVRIVRGFVTSIVHRRIREPDERLAWLLIAATIPVAIAGLLADRLLRTALGRPVPTAVFLIANGVVLWLAESLTRRTAAKHAHPDETRDGFDERREGIAADRVLARLPWSTTMIVGLSQITALAAGVSRSGVATVAGMSRGLTREDAARFSFLLATPVILAAGVLKLPDLTGPLGDGIRGQVLFAVR